MFITIFSKPTGHFKNYKIPNSILFTQVMNTLNSVSVYHIIFEDISRNPEFLFQQGTFTLLFFLIGSFLLSESIKENVRQTSNA
jgi:hypothetical protein